MNSTEDRSPIPEVAEAIERATQRGEVVVKNILSQPDMLSARELSNRLGVSHSTVHRWRKNVKLLAFQRDRHSYRYPEWQIGADGYPYPEIQDLQKILEGPWSVYRLLTMPHGEIEGRTGLEALRADMGERVVATAHAINEGTFA